VAGSSSGIYYMPQSADGRDFFVKWLEWENKDVGHDQDGLNTMVRYATHAHYKGFHSYIHTYYNLIDTHIYEPRLL
jgi:hypothetical protein